MKTLVKSMLLVMCFLSTTSHAQKQESSPALASFVHTPLMAKLLDIKDELEVKSASVKFDTLSSLKELRVIKRAHDTTALLINSFLEQLKIDFSNLGRRKYIQKLPENYLNGLRTQLFDIGERFNQQYLRRFNIITKDRRLLKDPVQILPPTATLNEERILLLIKETKRLNEYYFEDYFVRFFRVKLWDELSDGYINR